MAERRFQQVDVFAAAPFGGNPVAVVHDAEGLSTEEMQRFTRWMNLSETTFLLPPESPDADYRVRIFTLSSELPFAGHPTIGTCHAWLAAGGTPRTPGVVVQECGAGLVPLRIGDGNLSFAAPPIVRGGPVDDDLLADLLAVVGIERSAVVDAEWADNGPGWVALLLEDADAVLAVDADWSRWPRPEGLFVGLVGSHPPGAECAYEVRALFTDASGGMLEDPVTGSLNASVAQWMLRTGRVTVPYVAAQGTRLGRQGRIHISQDPDGAVWVGGAAVTHVHGSVTLDAVRPG